MEVPSELVDRARNVGLDLEQHFVYSLEKSLDKLEEDGQNRGVSNSEGKSDKGNSEMREGETSQDFLENFREHLEIERELADSTIQERMRYAEKLVEFLDGHPAEANQSDLREFVEPFDDHNAKKALKDIYKKYLGKDIVDSFKIQQSNVKPKEIPSKDKLQDTFENLEDLEVETAFLIWATSGLRRGELLGITLENIDRDMKKIVPEHDTQTKKSWLSFYNNEAEEKLNELLSEKSENSDPEIFSLHKDTYTTKIREASNGDVTPQKLRQWFTEKMTDLGISERYIEAFCGRTPNSVLGKNYTDYSPEKMKRRYEEAGITVLE